jgi:nicotinamide mononucleotide transporter
LQVSRLVPRHAALFGFIAVAGTLMLGSAMQRFTDASYPFPDAFIAVASLIAQYLMSRKILESWLVWIVVDVISIGLFLAKSLYPTTVLYSLFLVLAVWGWFAWRRTCTSPATA